MSKGGMFVLAPATMDGLFIPEMKNEEQAMIYNSSRDFVRNSILPIFQRIENKEEGLATALFKEMGQLGLLGAHMPTEYGGADFDANTVAMMLNAFGDMGSFNTPFAAHTGIGMLPILYFGTEKQKSKYLPSMIEGDIIASYCLTEPTSGSDALSAKTTAIFDEEKDAYIINGQKMWISNAGYAHIFIVFAQVDGDKFTGFIVERDSPGLTLGAEEKKLGIHGSSTRQVYFENVEVGREAILGEIGQGHLIAFNVLNMGRFKLGALCAAGAKNCMLLSATYANERIQFDRPIASFGAIQSKLAWQAARTAALESATFRISSLLTDKIAHLKEEGLSSGEAKLRAAKEYAVECSVIKVAGSEVIDYVVDETLQIYGGMGYSEEAPPARLYRDARINRIYEGTNEINRLLIVDQLFKRGMKGHLPLMEVLMSGGEMPVPEVYSKEAHQVRKVVLKLLGYLGRKQMEGNFNLEEEQILTMAMSDIGIHLFMLESLWLRKEKRKALGMDHQDFWQDMFDLYHFYVVEDSHKHLFTILSRIFKGEAIAEKYAKLTAMLHYPEMDVVEVQRRIAQWVSSKNGEIWT